MGRPAAIAVRGRHGRPPPASWSRPAATKAATAGRRRAGLGRGRCWEAQRRTHTQHTRARVRARARARARTHARTHAHTHTQSHNHTITRTHAHTHTHTNHTHACKHARSAPALTHAHPRQKAEWWPAYCRRLNGSACPSWRSADVFDSKELTSCGRFADIPYHLKSTGMAVYVGHKRRSACPSGEGGRGTAGAVGAALTQVAHSEELVRPKRAANSPRRSPPRRPSGPPWPAPRRGCALCRAGASRARSPRAAARQRAPAGGLGYRDGGLTGWMQRSSESWSSVPVPAREPPWRRRACS